MRYEIKYPLPHTSYEIALRDINDNLAGFSEAYPSRWVNNIYFDTISADHYDQNAAGVSKRKKVRARWYGLGSWQDQDSLNLEIKSKKASLGTKQIKDIRVSSTDILELERTVSESILDHHYIATIQNRYLRNYYLSSDKQIRLTVDSQIASKMPRAHEQSFRDEEHFVIEVKFEEDAYDLFEAFAGTFPYRQQKNSKYANGMEMLYV